MLDRRETIYPEDLANRLDEYEKILACPTYGKWRARKLLQETDLEDMDDAGKQWICLLIWADNPKREIPDLIFQQIEMDTHELGADQKLFALFAKRLIRKRPEYATQVRDLFE